MSNAVATLVLQYNPPSPSKTDLCYKDFNKELQPDCSVYYFALWVATRQGNAVNPKHPTLHQAVLSQDILLAAYKTDTVLQFYHSIIPII